MTNAICKLTVVFFFMVGLQSTVNYAQEIDLHGVVLNEADIELTTANSQLLGGNNGEMFLEIELDKNSIFVGEQLQLSAQLYYRINGISNPQFKELEIPDTVIQRIDPPDQYGKIINGERFGVYERKYVIIPQRAGPLKIPDILFRGYLIEGESSFVFRNVNTRGVFAFKEGMTIEVKELPIAESSNNN